MDYLAGKYILKDGNPVEATDWKEWVECLESTDRIVNKTYIGDVEISTVFLALDHSHGIGRPILYETMIFGGDLDGEMDRYTSRIAAVEGHWKFVKRVELSLKLESNQ